MGTDASATTTGTTADQERDEPPIRFRGDEPELYLAYNHELVKQIARDVRATPEDIEDEFDTTVPIILGIEGLSCGYDVGEAVTEDYATPFHFTGTVKRVTVDVVGRPRGAPRRRR